MTTRKIIALTTQTSVGKVMSLLFNTLSKFWQLYDGVNGINGNPSYPYMTPGKAIALTRQKFVNKVMSLLFNTLSLS